MKAYHQRLYKKLVNAYYEGHFEKTYQEILESEFTDLQEAQSVLSALCGVEITSLDKNDGLQKVVEAITHQRIREKIVHKIGSCNEDCKQIDGKSKCQSVCPFDAIIKDTNSQDKWIDDTLCMECGRCVSACEQSNYIDIPQFIPLLDLLKNKEKVVAIVAPAIAGQFGNEVTLDQLREAFIQLGFADMIEVAMAADVLSIKEALEFNNHVAKEGDFMITSCCCPIWVAALKKVYHELVPDVSPSVSPMIAMARIIKKLNPSVKVVFVGPCVAKKAEAKEPDLIGSVDYVLTFQELETIFETFEIHPDQLIGVPSVDYASTGGRLYARAGGVAQAIGDIVDQLYPNKRTLFKSHHVDGMKDCKQLLEDLAAGKVEASFIEGMGCQGGCVGGPKAIISAELGREHVDATAYESAIKIPVHSPVLKELLERIGITKVEDLGDKGSLFERQFK